MSDFPILAKAKARHDFQKYLAEAWWNDSSEEEKLEILGEVGRISSDLDDEITREAYQGELISEGRAGSLPENISEVIKNKILESGGFPAPPIEDYNITRSEVDEAEEVVELSMNPDVSKETLREARRFLVESDKTDFQNILFNGSKINIKPLQVPKVQGVVGYNDNPNNGLYDTKQFIVAPSTKRYTGFESIGENKQKYDPTATLSEITFVEVENNRNTDNELDNIDFSEDDVEYVYPTKAEESYTKKNEFESDYGDSDTESDDEAVQNQITDRKMKGYGEEGIARELEIMYGLSHDDALQKVYSIEVSTNDRVANTFFGKRYADCTESEKQQLRVFSGSDEE